MAQVVLLTVFLLIQCKRCQKGSAIQGWIKPLKGILSQRIANMNSTIFCVKKIKSVLHTQPSQAGSWQLCYVINNIVDPGVSFYRANLSELQSCLSVGGEACSSAGKAHSTQFIFQITLQTSYDRLVCSDLQHAFHLPNCRVHYACTACEPNCCYCQLSLFLGVQLEYR